MVDAVVRQEALVAVAARLLEIAPRGMVQVYAGFQSPAGEELHGAIIGAVNQGSSWGFGQFDQDRVVYDLVQAYFDACDEKWATLEVTVDHAGEWNADHGYDPLPEGEPMDPALLERLQQFPARFTARFGDVPPG